MHMKRAGKSAWCVRSQAPRSTTESVFNRSYGTFQSRRRIDDRAKLPVWCLNRSGSRMTVLAGFQRLVGRRVLRAGLFDGANKAQHVADDLILQTRLFVDVEVTDLLVF